jgi:hypothetical protein
LHLQSYARARGTPTGTLAAITPLQCLHWTSRNGVPPLGFGDVAGTIAPGADIALAQADALNMARGSGRLDKMLVHSGMRHNVDTVIADSTILKWKGKIARVYAAGAARKQNFDP